jgi:HEAT repeat protein
MAEVMELVPAVADELLLALEDEDYLIRAAAADALQFYPTKAVQQALRKSASDRSGAVQNAAKSSLAVFDEIARRDSTAVLISAEDQR